MIIMIIITIIIIIVIIMIITRIRIKGLHFNISAVINLYPNRSNTKKFCILCGFGTATVQFPSKALFRPRPKGSFFSVVSFLLKEPTSY